MKYKRLKFMSLFLSLAMVLSACGSSPSADDQNTSDPISDNSSASIDTQVSTKKTPDDTLVYALTTSNSHFNPTDSVSDWYTPIFMTYETLLYLDSSGNTYPGLATDWEWVDETTLHFTLREGVTFSDGTPFTGEDVLFSFQRGLDANSSNMTMSQIDFESSYYEGNDLYLVLKEPNSEFLYFLTRVFGSIVSKEYVETNGEDYFKLNPMGTGPYIMTEFIEGESITYKRNENYWGEEPAYETVIIKTIVEESTRALSFEAGEIDVAIMTTADTISTFTGREETDGIQVWNQEGCKNYFLNLGDISEYFQIRELRLAVAHAVDWQALVTAIWGDYGYLPDSCVPEFCQQYTPIGTYEYDPELSKQLMEQAGYPDGFTVSMAVSSSGNDVMIATILQSYLDDVGITFDLTVTDNATARSMSATGEVTMSIGQVDGSSGMLTDAMRSKLTGSNSLLMEVHTDTEEGAQFQSMVQEYKANFDEEQKAEMAKEIQQFVYDECLWIPISVVNTVMVNYDYIENMEDFTTNWVVNSGPMLNTLYNK